MRGAFRRLSVGLRPREVWGHVTPNVMGAMMTEPLPRLRKRGGGRAGPEPASVSPIRSNVARVSAAHPGSACQEARNRLNSCLMSDQQSIFPPKSLRLKAPGALRLPGLRRYGAHGQRRRFISSAIFKGLKRWRPRRLTSAPASIDTVAAFRPWRDFRPSVARGRRGHHRDGLAAQCAAIHDSRTWGDGIISRRSAGTGHKLELVLIVCGDCNVCMRRPASIPA